MFESLLSTSFGRRLKVSVFEDTKIGVLPGRPGGNFGGVIDSPLGFSVALSEFGCLPLLLSCCNRCFCLSFSLALNGEGRRSLKFVTIDGANSS